MNCIKSRQRKHHILINIQDDLSINKIKLLSVYFIQTNNMRFRRSTITEEYSPKFRRRITSIGKSSLLNVSMPHLIVYDQDGISICPSNIDENEQYGTSSHQPSQLRLYEKRTEEQLQQFKSNTSKIHKIIDQIDEFIKRRMEIHESQLITVVRKQIDGMMEDSRKVVEHYNRMMQEKNKQTQIYHLQNELNYFREISLNLYEDNKRFKSQYECIKKEKQEQSCIIQELKAGINKLTKKYMKVLHQTKGKSSNEQLKHLEKKLMKLSANESHYIDKYLNQTFTKITKTNQSKEKGESSHDFKEEERTHMKSQTHKKLKPDQRNQILNLHTPYLTEKHSKARTRNHSNSTFIKTQIRTENSFKGQQFHGIESQEKIENQRANHRYKKCKTSIKDTSAPKKRVDQHPNILLSTKNNTKTPHPESFWKIKSLKYSKLHQ